ELAERTALLREPRRSRLRPGHEAGDAEIGMTAQALLAASAEAREAGHHVIAGLDGRHIGADRLDDTGTLVSQDDRPVERKPALAIHHVQIAMAHARRGGANQDLAPPGLVDLDGFDRQRLLDFAKDGGLHLHAGFLPSEARVLTEPRNRTRRSIIPTSGEEGEHGGRGDGEGRRAERADPGGDGQGAGPREALGRHGGLRFPAQQLEATELRDFSRRFGRIQATLTGRHHEPGMPEVGYLSNIIENGEPIGITDAGQDWHTDMSYNETVGFLNV